MSEPDAELWYHVGELMAACGQTDPALRLLKSAVQQNYCAYSALLDDPLLKNLRKETAFNEDSDGSQQLPERVQRRPPDKIAAAAGFEFSIPESCQKSRGGLC